MIRQIWTIARNTFTESIRQPIYTVLLSTVILLLILGMLWSHYTLDDNSLLMVRTALSMIFFGGLILATFTASSVLAREIDNKTVLTVVSKPIGRPVFILGKYLGVSLAVGLAVWCWSLVLLMLVRHRVVQAAYESVDGPVILFGIGALFISFWFALIGNYLYNWVFSARYAGALAVTLTIAFSLVLVISKDWVFQSPLADFYHEEHRIGQVLLALLLALEGLMLICAVAIACSTRLPLVSALGVCIFVYMVGAASDNFFGQHAETQPMFWIAYALPPNMQYYFAADALSQKHAIPMSYIGRISAYTACYITAVLAMAIALFQTRETG